VNLFNNHGIDTYHLYTFYRRICKVIVRSRSLWYK